MISITATSLKSPMSGTRTSTGPVLTAALTPVATGATEFVAGDALTTGSTACFISEAGAADAGTPATSATSSISTSEPSLTLSPSATRSSLTTPAWLDGISIDALSDSTVIRDCSAFTVSPGLTINSITVTSAKSPISGTLISIKDMRISLFIQLRTALHFAAVCPAKSHAKRRAD